MKHAPRLLLPLVGAVGLLSPTCAAAHLVATGFGPAYDGAAHLLFNLDDILTVSVLGLYAGRLGPPAARTALGLLPLGFAVGGAAAAVGMGLPPLPGAAAAALAMIFTGVLLAADLWLPPQSVGVLAFVLGATRGLSDVDGLTPAAAAAPLAGMVLAAVAAFALTASVTLPLRRRPLVIAARILGSWAAAVGLLLGGWLLRVGARAE